MCTTSPWAQGPVCNVIANAAWLPEYVSSVGGQGVHPIKGEMGVMERVQLQAKAAQVCNTQGSQLHPKTGETETRKRRTGRDMNTHKAMKRVESDTTWRRELCERGGDGTQVGEMDVVAAQESEGGVGGQRRDGHGERTSARDDNTTRGMKCTREDDEGRAGHSRRRKEQAAEQGCRRTMMAHNAHTTPTLPTTNIITTTTTTTTNTNHTTTTTTTIHPLHTIP